MTRTPLAAVLLVPVLLAAARVAAQEPPPAAPDPAPPVAATGEQVFPVRVEDDQGRPAADVAVVLGRRVNSLLQFERLAGTDAVRTDADGRALLRCAASEPRDGLEAEAQVLCEPPLRVPVHMLLGRGGCYLIRMPPTGQVRVLVYGDDEKPLEDVASVDLGIVGNKRFFDRVRPGGRLEKEGAQFAHVALGLQVRASAALTGTAGVLAVERAGPVRPGELVVIDLRLRAARLLSMRLLGLDGAPVAATPLIAMLRAGPRYEVRRVSTRADGVFRWLVPDGFGGDGAFAMLVRRGDGDVPECLGSLRLDLAPAWAGTRDLGAQRLAEEKPVAGGVLVDESGAPLPGVVVSAEPSYGQGATFSTINVRRSEHRVRTDSDGRFALREVDALPAQFVLATEDGWYLPRHDRLKVGDLDARVVAVRGGEIELVLPGLPEGLEVDCVDAVRREFQGPGMMPAFPKKVVVGEGSRLLFSGLQPGTYDVGIGTSQLSHAQRRIEGVEVAGGARVAGDRLVVADWRDVLRVVEVTVDGEATLREKAQLNLYEVAAHGYGGRGLGWVGTSPRVVVVPRHRKLVVSGPRCATVVVDDPPEQVRIALEPRPEVVFALAEGILLPGTVRLRFAGRGRPWLSDEASTVAVGDARSWKVRVDGRGVFSVTALVPRGNGEYDEVACGEVEVPAAAAPAAPVVLPLGAKAVAEIGDKMGQRGR